MRHSLTVHLSSLTNPRNPLALGKPLTGHHDEVFSVAFSPMGRNWPLAAKITVRLSNLAIRNAPTTPGPTLLGHLGAVFTVAFSPTSPILATGGDEETVILCDLDERPPAPLGSPSTAP